ncbi:peritrophin-44 [Drosophila albomicans]|uniref:Peritrophin-44 n=1 Tax=Drosophila albomicans TaxID=7291 RepID=A0A6P8Z2U5_DROAB|nr:peritrophin-44 [Drosophila albomicans]
MISCIAAAESERSLSTMKVSNQFLNAFVWTALLWQSSSSGISMEFVCNYWHGTGHIGDSSDCQAWAYCSNNKLVGRGYCPKGYFHDAPSGMCELAREVRCVPQDWERCAQQKEGDYLAEPFDCRKYKKCGDDEVYSCADGYLFSNRLQTCVSSAAGCPQRSIDICAFMPSGTTVGDPQNCGLYLECLNGASMLKVCTAQRYYNYKNGICQTLKPEHCGEDGFEVVKKQPPATDANVCAEFYQSDRSGDQFISDSLTCQGYYTCSSQYAIGKWHSCPLGKHFQWWSQKCVNPDTYSCPFDRCANLNSTFVTAINTGCTEYIFCKNQTSNRLLKCPDDYPYFDEKRGVCVDKYPNYTVCFMND